MKAKGVGKPVVPSLAGDGRVEEAAEYLYQNGIPAHAYPTGLPVPGAQCKWVRGAGLIGRAACRAAMCRWS